MDNINEDKNWSKDYSDLVQRNIGILSIKQQNSLKNSKVAVFGMGGIGSPAFEILVRSGIEKFAIIDKDYFEKSNMNRQIYAFNDTLGKNKVDTAKEFALKINPSADISCFTKVDEKNIESILSGVSVALLAIDELKPCIIISRKAGEMNIPLVEGWAIPYGNVRTFTKDTPSLEEAYSLPTKGKPLADFSDAEISRLGLEVLFSLGNTEGITDFYPEDIAEKLEQGFIPSFAPMVWLTSVLMATEVLKILTGIGEFASAPDFKMYDPFKHRIPSVSH